MVTREKFITTQEFWEIARLPENENKRLELEDGVIVEMLPSSPINTIVAGRLSTFLNNYIMQHNLGYVTLPDGEFRLATGRVRQPDTAFISRERVPKVPDEFEIAPDLAVEVASPNEDMS